MYSSYYLNQGIRQNLFPDLNIFPKKLQLFANKSVIENKIVLNDVMQTVVIEQKSCFKTHFFVPLQQNHPITLKLLS